MNRIQRETRRQQRRAAADPAILTLQRTVDSMRASLDRILKMQDELIKAIAPKCLTLDRVLEVIGWSSLHKDLATIKSMLAQFSKQGT